MRTPQRKPGKYSGLKQDPHISPEKLNELIAKLSRLKDFSRPKSIKEVKLLAQDGDFSENAAYQIAKSRLRGINHRISEIEDLLKRAIIIKADRSSRTVKIGSCVDLSANGRDRTYRILGPAEADPTLGIISYQSPLGQALMDRQAGDEVKVDLKDKTLKYKIIKIS